MAGLLVAWFSADPLTLALVVFALFASSVELRVERVGD